MDRILACRGTGTKRTCLIRWVTQPSPDTWESRSCVHPELIKECELASGNYDFSWKFRCPECDLPCASQWGVKIHMIKAHKPTEDQAFTGRITDKRV